MIETQIATANLEAVVANERLLRPKDVTRRLNISSRTFERLLSAGSFPKPDLRIGRVTLWKPETLTFWIESESARQRGRGGRA